MSESTTSRIPRFSSVEEEAQFWDAHSLVEFFGDEWEPVEAAESQGSPGYRFELTIALDREQSRALAALAERLGLSRTELVTRWVLAGLDGGEGVDARPPDS